MPLRGLSHFVSLHSHFVEERSHSASLHSVAEWLHSHYASLHSYMLQSLIILSYYIMIHFTLFDLLSMIFSIRSVYGILSMTSENFERGSYPLLNTNIRYRFNYWFIIIHFLVFEQELILCLLFFIGIQSLNSNNLLCPLLGIPLFDSFM